MFSLRPFACGHKWGQARQRSNAPGSPLLPAHLLYTLQAHDVRLQPVEFFNIAHLDRRAKQGPIVTCVPLPPRRGLEEAGGALPPCVKNGEECRVLIGVSRYFYNN